MLGPSVPIRLNLRLDDINLWRASSSVDVRTRVILAWARASRGSHACQPAQLPLSRIGRLGVDRFIWTARVEECLVGEDASVARGIAVRPSARGNKIVSTWFSVARQSDKLTVHQYYPSSQLVQDCPSTKQLANTPK